MSEQRRNSIRDFVREWGEVSGKQLAELFPNVSGMTIRRDLQKLETDGVLLRTRGGAVFIGSGSGVEDVYALRAAQNIDAKRQIARKAVDLIEDNRSIYIDSGTTMMCLARILPDARYSVITSGPNIALEAARRTLPQVILLGGALNRNNLTASGELAREWLNHLNIDIAFLAASGYTQENGFSSGVASECDLKRAVVEKARRKIVLMDASKLDRLLPYTFAHIGDIDILVMDTEPGDELRGSASGAGVIVK